MGRSTSTFKRGGRDQANVLVENAMCIRETEKALLIAVEGTQHWVPKSQVDYDESEVTKLGDEGYIVLSAWIAKEKGW